ncbi:MAG: hypothetical protein ACK5YW_10710 [Betaproteobacteria bacterium]|nr:hypothetical protein [Rhodocyclaceae bacterium]MCA3133925.1 hypothetical protein [Rhodocyclaceae bacterium]MCA3142049.1 hypothetical protein [Rhodocyclaceae bacterium]MCA3147179.1 hypothetical protein [Rhodocyclaceae bacterium]
MTYPDLSAWRSKLRFEYPSVRFEQTDAPAGINAVCEGVLVGRFFAERDPPFGVVYAQPRSCGGKPF